MEACCTCAKLLSAEALAPRSADSAAAHGDHAPEKTSEVMEEKESVLPEDRRLDCCTRVICGKCLFSNKRFSRYCPFCQVSSGPSTLPDRLREPPPYTSAVDPRRQLSAEAPPPPPYHAIPPAYSDAARPANPNLNLDEKTEGEQAPAPDTLHFLNHEHDTIASLSLRYGVPATALRAKNKLTSDHLLLARRAILIPGEFYKRGVSLSPRPIEGEEEEARKGKIRRFMVTCKVVDYDIAVLYLEQAGYDIDLALESYFADELWEKEHPLEGNARRLGRLGARSDNRGGYTVRDMGGTRASQAAFLRRRL